ncbi:unnamed protein product, partial [Mesorhabditis spiculigera]
MSSTIRGGLRLVDNQQISGALDRKASLNKTPLPVRKDSKKVDNDDLRKEVAKVDTAAITAAPIEKLKEFGCQSDVSCMKEYGPVTAEDLTSEEPSTAYWADCDRSYSSKIDKELERSIDLTSELLNITHELEEKVGMYSTLQELLDEEYDIMIPDVEEVLEADPETFGIEPPAQIETEPREQ